MSMIHHISASDFRKNLKEMLNIVRYKGEKVVVTSNGKITAVVISPDDAKSLIQLEENDKK